MPDDYPDELADEQETPQSDTPEPPNDFDDFAGPTEGQVQPQKPPPGIDW